MHHWILDSTLVLCGGALLLSLLAASSAFRRRPRKPEDHTENHDDRQ